MLHAVRVNSLHGACNPSTPVFAQRVLRAVVGSSNRNGYF